MVKWMSKEWLDEYARLWAAQPERPGMSSSIEYVVTGGPAGDVTYFQVIKDGMLIESDLGPHPDPELRMTQSYQDSMKISKGELEAGAAFMQGKIKVDGDLAQVMALLPMTNSAEYRQMQAELRAVTEY